jgi:DNA-directed RNA polymerase specialized sigma24 family protein
LDYHVLLQRLRRLGWILLGNQELADKVLQDLLVAPPRDRDAGEDAAHRLFRIAFEAFDEVAHGLTNVYTWRPKRPGQDLLARLRQLNPDERTAIAMMVVEPFSMTETASVTGRQRSTLAFALQRALMLLEEEES